MSIYIENEYSFDFNIEAVAESLLDAVLDYVGFDIPVELSIVITDNNEIRELNRQYRGIDKETDVISFPAVEYSRAADFSEIDFEDPKYYNSDTGDFIIGDMIISYDRVVGQALEYGHSIKREFSFLVVHSLLHLFGYDHESIDEEKLMREKQTEILNSLDIRR